MDKIDTASQDCQENPIRVLICQEPPVSTPQAAAERFRHFFFFTATRIDIIVAAVFFSFVIERFRLDCLLENEKRFGGSTPDFCILPENWYSTPGKV
jgi:hypothetical protein